MNFGTPASIEIAINPAVSNALRQGVGKLLQDRPYEHARLSQLGRIGNAIDHLALPLHIQAHLATFEEMIDKIPNIDSHAKSANKNPENLKEIVNHCIQHEAVQIWMKHLNNYFYDYLFALPTEGEPIAFKQWVIDALGSGNLDIFYRESGKDKTHCTIWQAFIQSALQSYIASRIAFCESPLTRDKYSTIGLGLTQSLLPTVNNLNPRKSVVKGLIALGNGLNNELPGLIKIKEELAQAAGNMNKSSTYQEIKDTKYKVVLDVMNTIQQVRENIASTLNNPNSDLGYNTLQSHYDEFTAAIQEGQVATCQHSSRISYILAEIFTKISATFNSFFSQAPDHTPPAPSPAHTITIEKAVPPPSYSFLFKPTTEEALCKTQTRIDNLFNFAMGG